MTLDGGWSSSTPVQYVLRCNTGFCPGVSAEEAERLRGSLTE